MPRTNLSTSLFRGMSSDGLTRNWSLSSSSLDSVCLYTTRGWGRSLFSFLCVPRRLSGFSLNCLSGGLNLPPTLGTLIVLRSQPKFKLLACWLSIGLIFVVLCLPGVLEPDTYAFIMFIVLPRCKKLLLCKSTAWGVFCSKLVVFILV